MFDGRLDVTPPVTDEAFANVPGKRGVLLLVADAERPITLITAGNLRGRLRTRLAEDDADGPSRRIDLRQITRAAMWRLTHSYFETDLAYLDLARRIWPDRYRTMVAWKPAWGVHVDCDAAAPHFARIRGPAPDAGVSLGPFPSARSADQFIKGVQDVFDLCRDVTCLRTAPNGPPCSYGQMGRCLSPCDGSISMDDYGLVMRRATAFAAGDRAPTIQALTNQMTGAAEKLAFERAATIKTKLARVAELDGADYAFVAQADQFKYLLVQTGPNARTARTFFVNGPAVAAGPDLAYPLVAEQIATVGAQMSAFVDRGAVADEAGPWRTGLVARYLFSSQQRRGLIVPWTVPPSVSELTEQVASSAAALKLRAPKPRKRTKKADASPETPSRPPAGPDG